MQNWRQIALEAKDLLTVCLAKSIDQALVTMHGNDWFADFAQSDAEEKTGTQIVKQGQQSVHDMDMQAMLKILRFRTGLANDVLSYHGFFDGNDTFASEGKARQLRGLLDRLINDFRNRIEAHVRAADIEKQLSGKEDDRLYGYEEAYTDMCKLARIFSSTKDSDGKSYYDRMVALATPKKKKKVFPAVIGAIVSLAVIIGLGAWFLPFGGNVYENKSDPMVKQGEITVQPIKVYYDNGSLVAKCYIINGTDETVSKIDMSAFRVTENGRTVAEADFGVIGDITIDPGKAVKRQFRFPKDTVKVRDARLSDMQMYSSCSEVK